MMERLLGIVKRLRSDDGCPWDREQTLESMSKYLLEEAAEAVDAVVDGKAEEIAEELGDILLVVAMMAQILNENEGISFEDIEEKISEKMIRRHPHVFGDERLETAEEVLENWGKIKSDDEKKPLFFEKVPRSLHPFELTLKLQKDASKYGFDWKSGEPVVEKVKEEMDEFLEQVVKGNKEEKEKEFGDVIFSLLNLSRFVDIEPTLALRKVNKKFIDRLKYIKKHGEELGKTFEELSFEEMDSLWEKAKRDEKNGCK